MSIGSALGSLAKSVFTSNSAKKVYTDIGLALAGSAVTAVSSALARGGKKRSLKDAGAFRECPFCAEDVLAKAIKCKHCGSEIALAK